MSKIQKKLKQKVKFRMIIYILIKTICLDKKALISHQILAQKILLVKVLLGLNIFTAVLIIIDKIIISNER